ncbi:hypothetical protein GGR54DRAFT_50763 [Hypoxylon sp. NC1633]|nr:hypothetical protein GGR54DRAFT_50763 [Hypoxylon sp. NC1633]
MVDTSSFLPYSADQTSNAPVQRPAMPGQFMPVVENAYSITPLASPQTPQYPSNNHYLFGSYTPPSPPTAPSFKHYSEQCPPPRPMATDPEVLHVGYRREICQTDTAEQDRTPHLKYEPKAITQRLSTPVPSAASKTITRNAAENEANEVVFNTDVDSLMKAIQVKGEPVTGVDFGETAYPSPPQVDEEKFDLRRKSCSPEDIGFENGREKKERQKRYVCDIKGCGKRCSQKTQLETHKRAHTGEKPFVCSVPGCGQGFTQRGNMKTHQRCHTGEKPYRCDICGKAFAQLGNVKPHKLIHSKTKPFRCILDGCQKISKTFGQRGNLKHHHNKYHAETIKELTQRFRSLGPGEELPEQDQKLFLHFAELYKNSNKGIKGRGKNRTVAPKHQISNAPRASPPHAVQPTAVVQHMFQYHLPLQHGLGNYGIPRNGALSDILAAPDAHAAYGTYDQASITSSETATDSSSPATIYEDEHRRGFTSQGRIY